MANLLNNRFNINTYNPMFPGLNKSNYDKVIAYGNSLGLESEEEKRQAESSYYRKNVNSMINSQLLDERDDELNQQAYYAANISTQESDIELKKAELTQTLKRKYNLNAKANDNEVFDEYSKGLNSEGKRMLAEYLAGKSDEFLYVAGLAERPENNQGGIKSMVNPASEDRIVAEKSEWANPIGATAETIDNAANKFADKWLDWGNTLNEIGTESLKEKLDNMSQKEIEEYRKKYKEMLKNKDWRTAQVEGDTIVEQLWNAAKGDLNYDYNDEDFGKWLIQQKANLGEYMVGADDVLQGETNPNVIQFFGNIPSSAVKTFTATVRGLTNPYDTMKGLYKIALTEEGHQAILDRYGSWDAFAKAMNTDPVGVADDILAVAEGLTSVAKGGLKTAGKITGNQSLTNAANKISSLNIGSANDALANKTVGKVFSTMDNLAGDNTLLKTANRYMQDVSSIQKLKDNAKTDLDIVKDSAAGQAIKNYVNEGIDKLVGVNEEDRKFIRENKDLVNQYIDGKKNVENVFDDVKNKINDKRAANAEMGKEYETLRENKAKVVDTTGVTSDMKKSLKKNGITIDKKTGELKFDDLSKYNAKQQKALQDAWKELQALEKAKKINAGNVLDMRQKMDDKLNWDGKPADLKDVSSVDKSTEKLIKEMRGVIDARAKGSVQGLRELDEKFAPAMAEMEKIQKDWLNSDGTLKDTARSKIRNLTKAGNEERLARLEKLMPGITNDLKALDVGLTIDRASKQGVGQYAKNIGLGSTLAFAASGNIPAALVSAGVGVLSTPKNFVRLIEAYPDIAKKLQAGGKLLPADINRLQSLASRLEDGIEE